MKSIQRSLMFILAVWGMVMVAPALAHAIDIHNCAELQMIGNDPAYPLYGNYVLANDINCSGIAFHPIGNSFASPFHGSLNGQGHTITGLTIDGTHLVVTSNVGIGLFSVVNGTISNLQIKSASVKVLGAAQGGILAGVIQQGSTISNVTVEGSVVGIGKPNQGIQNQTGVGGLVGENLGTILQSSANATVTGGTAGGLAGVNYGAIKQSFSTGIITGNLVGGLVGFNAESFGPNVIQNSYSQATVILTDGVFYYPVAGGLVGVHDTSSGNITNSYATGLVKLSNTPPSAYNLGGVIGRQFTPPGNMVSIYWDMTSSHQSNATQGENLSGVTGASTTGMYSKATYAGWDFDNVWYIVEGQGYPVLKWQLEPAASLWNTFSILGINWSNIELISQGTVNWTYLNGVGINWSDVNRLKEFHINWTDLLVMSRPFYWSDQPPVISTDTNWADLNFVLNYRAINWYDVGMLSRSSINWASVNPLVKIGTNWLDWAVLSTSSIDWSNFLVLTRAGINWQTLSIVDKLGTHWMDWSLATRTGVNWYDIAVLSNKGINWNSLGVLSDPINWADVSVLSRAHIPWNTVNQLSHNNIYWDNISLLNSIPMTPRNLFTLREIGVSTDGKTPPPPQIANFTWIGMGPDNNWSTSSNWQGGVAPGVGNVAIFNNISSKNVVIDVSVNVGGINIGSGYSGTITQRGTISLIGDFSLMGGTFNANGQILGVSGLTTISGGTYLAATALQIFNGGLTIAGGTFIGSSGDVVTTHMTLSSGTLTAPSGAFYVSGNWVHTAGTFTPGTNTVTLNGTNQTISGTNTFYNLTKSVNANSTLTFPSNLTTTITGTLTLNGDATHTLTLASSAASYLITPLIAAQNLTVAAGILDAKGLPISVGGTLSIASGANIINLPGPTSLLAELNKNKPIVELTWRAPTGVSVSSYEIYRNNGELLGSTSGLSYKDKTFDLEQCTAPFTYYVKGVIKPRTQTVTLPSNTVQLDCKNSSIPQYTWIGAGPDNNWSTSSNWQGGVVPGVGNVAIFNRTSNKNVIIDVNINVGGINIGSDYSGTITVVGNNTITVGTSGWTQSNGAFIGWSGNITINGTFSLMGGSFTSSSSTLTLNGSSFTHTVGGTFNANGGTVILTGSSATIDVNGTETFSNLIINTNTGSNVTISSGDTLLVNGNVTLINGVVNGGTISTQGNVTIASSFDGGNGPLQFTGSGIQMITGAGSFFNGDIVINKTGGEVDLASNLIMDAAGQDLIIAAGTFDISGYNLTVNGVGSTFTIANGATFQLQGSETMTTPTRLFNRGSRVAYDGSGSYAIKNWSYPNLTMRGRPYLTAPLIVAQNVTVASGILDAKGFTISVGETLSIAPGANVINRRDTARIKGSRTKE